LENNQDWVKNPPLNLRGVGGVIKAIDEVEQSSPLTTSKLTID